MEVRGKVIEVTAPESGISKAGNAWKKQGFTIETLDHYPKSIYFDLFGEKIDMLPAVGDDVQVKFDIIGRRSSSNGRWYNSITAWSVAKVTVTTTPIMQQPHQPTPQPMYQQPQAPTPTPTARYIVGNNSGLPF